MSFDRLGLSPELLRVVADQGYTEPTPIQAQAIPFVLEGRDVLAGAQTGTGKTAAFVLPILDRLHATAAPGRDRDRRPRVLVLVPTRELALQVEESVRTYGARRPVRSVAIYGGVGYEPQFRALRRGTEVVVATPGRLLDHLEQRTIDLTAIEILVLDEADRMLDMGFIRDIRRILAILPAHRQNLLFSATFNDEIRALAAGFLRAPAHVQATPRNTTTGLVRQVVIRVDRERKRDLLRELVASGRIDQALVFTRTKHGANRLAEQLGKDGIATAAIHGNRSQSQRVRALTDFKAGRVTLLVATEVAARGIDIEELPHVVNYELPMVPEDYLHRIGRTGRAGVEGDAISLVCVDELKLLRDIEALLGRRIETEIVAGFEPDRSIRAEPIRLRTAGHVPGRMGQGQRFQPGHRGGRLSTPARAGQHHGQRSGQRPGQRPSGAPAPSVPGGSAFHARPAAGPAQHGGGTGAHVPQGPQGPHAPRRRPKARSAPARPAGAGFGNRPMQLPGERFARNAGRGHA